MNGRFFLNYKVYIIFLQEDLLEFDKFYLFVAKVV